MNQREQSQIATELAIIQQYVVNTNLAVRSFSQRAYSDSKLLDDGNYKDRIANFFVSDKFSNKEAIRQRISDFSFASHRIADAAHNIIPLLHSILGGDLKHAMAAVINYVSMSSDSDSDFYSGDIEILQGLGQMASDIVVENRAARSAILDIYEKLDVMFEINSVMKAGID